MFEDVTSASEATPEPVTPAAVPRSEPAKPAASAAPVPAAAARPPAAEPSTPPSSEPLRPAAPAEPPPRIIDDAVAVSTGGVTWRWPGKGSLAGTFVAGDQTRQGIDIAGKAGDPVLAAADGEVVYSGNGLLGYGELIIVKHNANFLSAYGHNRKRLVQEGNRVKAGQQIAEMGSTASSRDQLHFEIRKNGKPVNPLEYLPAH
jgi:lipoprotein NlpD